MWRVPPKSDAFGQVIKIELVIDYESIDPELYNDTLFFFLLDSPKRSYIIFRFVFTNI